MIDWNKPIETTKGEKATVLCTDLNYSGYTVGVRVEHTDGTVKIWYSKQDGTNPGINFVNSPDRTYLFYPIIFFNSPKSSAVFFNTTEEAVRESEARFLKNRPESASYDRNFTGIVKVTLENGVPVKSEILPA